MAGEKAFTGNSPRTGRQRSAEQVTNRITDVLNYLNEFFVLTGDPLNWGTVFAIDELDGSITVKQALTFDGDIEEDKILIGDNAGDLQLEYGVIGQDQKYTVGPVGSVGQLMQLANVNGEIIFVDPPASTAFIDQAGNFTASQNINYNIEAGVEITIDDADVVPGFTFRVRPQRTEDFEVSNPTILYNGVNPFQNQTEDLNLDKNFEYTIYSQDGTTLQVSAVALSQDI